MNENKVKYRPIKSELKTKRKVLEVEKPVRWSFMKILREYSTLKQFYPEINPYVEVYKFRDNMYCLYSESLDGAGDPWMYLIEGPEKCMLIDTGFGLGDLKGLIKHIVGDKEIIVVNTHSHYDHAYGNCQFERCYCHKNEVYRMEQINNAHIWDYLFDENGKPKWTEFEKNDLVEYKEYEIIGVDNNYMFDLGDGYKVEAILLPGHTPGQCAYYDHHNHTIFIGDVTGVGKFTPGEPYEKYCTVEALYNALKDLQPRFDEIEGVFPGHGMLDQSSLMLQYLLDAVEAIMKNPGNYDTKSVRVMGKGEKREVCTKNIYQSTCLRYREEQVYMKEDN